MKVNRFGGENVASTHDQSESVEEQKSSNHRKSLSLSPRVLTLCLLVKTGPKWGSFMKHSYVSHQIHNFPHVLRRSDPIVIVVYLYTVDESFPSSSLVRKQSTNTSMHVLVNGIGLPRWREKSQTWRVPWTVRAATTALRIR